MGGGQYCSQCRTSHEGKIGKKCQLVHQGEIGMSGASNMDSQQASMSLFSDCSVNEDQANYSRAGIITK